MAVFSIMLGLYVAPTDGDAPPWVSKEFIQTGVAIMILKIPAGRNAHTMTESSLSGRNRLSFSPATWVVD
jgi:hypothetical protein